MRTLISFGFGVFAVVMFFIFLGKYDVLSTEGTGFGVFIMTIAVYCVVYLLLKWIINLLSFILSRTSKSKIICKIIDCYVPSIKCDKSYHTCSICGCKWEKKWGRTFGGFGYFWEEHEEEHDVRVITDSKGITRYDYPTILK